MSEKYTTAYMLEMKMCIPGGDQGGSQLINSELKKIAEIYHSDYRLIEAILRNEFLWISEFEDDLDFIVVFDYEDLEKYNLTLDEARKRFFDFVTRSPKSDFSPYEDIWEEIRRYKENGKKVFTLGSMDHIFIKMSEMNKDEDNPNLKYKCQIYFKGEFQWDSEWDDFASEEHIFDYLNQTWRNEWNDLTYCPTYPEYHLKTLEELGTMLESKTGKKEYSYR